MWAKNNNIYMWRELVSGPVLARFDRFFLIGSRTKGGLALRLLFTQTYTFYLLKLLVQCQRGAQVPENY